MVFPALELFQFAASRHRVLCGSVVLEDTRSGNVSLLLLSNRKMLLEARRVSLVCMHDAHRLFFSVSDSQAGAEQMPANGYQIATWAQYYSHVGAISGAP